MNFWDRTLVVFILTLTLIFTGSALAADKLRIGYGAPSVAMSVLWITKEGKLFEKNGLDVEVLYLESALVQRALIAGNIDYGEMTGSLMAAPKLQGADLVMVAGFLNQLIYRLVARPEIKTIADLKGKRVAVSRFGAGADRATRFLLTKLGFNPEKDVVLVQVGGAPTRLAALAANSIDATIVEPPDHKKAQEAGMRVLANMEEMGIPFQHTGLVTTRAHLAKYPDIARRVIKSFVEGIQLATVNPEVAKRALPQTHAPAADGSSMMPTRSCAASCRESPTRLSTASKWFSPNWPTRSLRRRPPTQKTLSTLDFSKSSIVPAISMDFTVKLFNSMESP